MTCLEPMAAMEWTRAPMWLKPVTTLRASSNWARAASPTRAKSSATFSSRISMRLCPASPTPSTQALRVSTPPLGSEPPSTSTFASTTPAQQKRFASRRLPRRCRRRTKTSPALRTSSASSRAKTAATTATSPRSLSAGTAHLAKARLPRPSNTSTRSSTKSRGLANCVRTAKHPSARPPAAPPEVPPQRRRVLPGRR
ncbi:MAG: hypothetical protein ACI9KE_006336 [Polyangiales bacterium]|jgi:hypothetical protein